MQQNFQKIYSDIIWEQKAYIGTLLLQQRKYGLPGIIESAWDWLVGNEPKVEQQVVKVANSSNPPAAIKKIALQISPEDRNAAIKIISSNPKINHAFNALDSEQKQNIFIAQLAAFAKQHAAKQQQEKAKQAADAFKEPEGKEKDLYDLIVQAVGDEAKAQNAWKTEYKKGNVIIYGKDGKYKAIPRKTFNSKPDIYINNTKKYMPKDADGETDIEDTLNDNQKKMLNIYVQSRGDGNTAKQAFLEAYAKGQIRIWNGKRNMAITKQKFATDVQKYIDMANKYNKNKDIDADASDTERNVDFDDYNDKLKQVLGLDKPGLKWKESKITRQMERAEDNDKVIILKKDGDKYSVSRIKKTAFAQHELDVDEGKLQEPTYFDIVEQLLGQKTDNDKAKADQDAKQQEAKDKADEWVDACRQYVKDLPSREIAWGMNPDWGYDFSCKANFFLFDCVDKKQIGEIYLNANGEIDDDEQKQKFRTFLNTNMTSGNPPHAACYYKIFKKWVDENAGRNEKQLSLLETWRDKAKDIAEKYGKIDEISYDMCIKDK